MKMMTAVDVAWLAGLLEGEGNFSPSGGYPRVTLGMSDRDIIDRVHILTGVGRVCTLKTKLKKHYKTMYRWKISRSSDAVKLMLWILPYMSARRSAKINTILSRYVPARRYGVQIESGSPNMGTLENYRERFVGKEE